MCTKVWNHNPMAYRKKYIMKTSTFKLTTPPNFAGRRGRVTHICVSKLGHHWLMIESTKTSSMEDVSTGVLEKIKNI